VRFGGMDVGGIRVSHMTGIAKPLSLALAVSKGKRAMYVVQPLAAEPQQKVPTLEELLTEAQKAATNDELTRIARAATATLKGADLDAVKAIVTARREDLKAAES
jgi:hypothetical protein